MIALASLTTATHLVLPLQVAFRQQRRHVSGELLHDLLVHLVENAVCAAVLLDPPPDIARLIDQLKHRMDADEK